ncbi:MAG TPA: glycosyltransferase family 4 protein [Candidatus Angelobacter sp.]|nr:glycosyltransferase family 4 protein [Candidatus Angelobacter sp.]
MRVLTVVTEAPPIRSGIALTVEQLAARLSARGHDVEVISAADVGRVSFGEVRLTGLAGHWRGIRERILAADVVHLHGPAPSFSDAFLALWRTIPRSRRPPLVYTHHCEIDLPAVGAACRLYERAHWRLARAASHVVVSSESYRRTAERRGMREVSVVPHGLPETNAPRLAKGPRFTVAFVGQLRPYKGAEVLLRAAAELPDVAVEIVGSGHQEVALRRLAGELRLDNVRWLGRAGNAERDRALARAHVVCLPSLTRAEAFGIVLLEGMRAGAVPVASDLPGVRDVAGATGLLCTPGDPRSLVQALVHLRDAPDDWRHRSWLSKRVSARYQWEQAAQRYEQIFAGLLGMPEMVGEPLLPLRALGRMVGPADAAADAVPALGRVLHLPVLRPLDAMERATWRDGDAIAEETTLGA